MPEPPVHRHEVNIHVGGNTVERVADALRDLADQWELRGSIPLSGISSNGVSFTHDEQPDVTEESFYEALTAWIDHRRSLPEEAR